MHLIDVLSNQSFLHEKDLFEDTKSKFFPIYNEKELISFCLGTTDIFYVEQH